MNCNLSHAGSAARAADRQNETSHGYMLGSYGLMERITTAFPAISFESGSGGGGRYHPGILYYMPQT